LKARSRARGWTLQVLYAWEMRGAPDPLDAFAHDMLAHRRVAQDSRSYIARLVDVVGAHRGNIDRHVQDALTNWRLNRLSAIDRAILRLAAAEMLYIDDVPPVVSIQEGVKLAEKYGTAESPRFVNGVLDALMRSIESEQTGGAA
jgi:transcription antitermination protein NusB